ncbi:MAG TPA: non-ribosomal peptide synthetase, partial [Blastocatellia bacterium]|nr:non-ribosomal peptide synthetase [Blastocatellia bacterium]
FTGDMVRVLASGRKMVICPGEWLLSAPDLYNLMREQAVDSCEMVPVLLHNLAEHLTRTGNSLDGMSLVVSGADTISVKELDSLRGICGPGARVMNSYGLTEVTIDSLYFESTNSELVPGQPAPIGRPFANTEIYLLDHGVQPVPAGVLGELYAGGPGLAWGYISEPGLTAEKFVPHSFSTRPGARLYRTGDLAKYLRDGNVDFAGRIDDQMKLRGYRVEPKEIEAVLARHGSVGKALVMAREHRPGETVLIAYVVPAQGAAVDVGELRQVVKENLPAYMAPSGFVVLEAFPTTPNGKVDRRALPAPDLGNAAEESYAAPTTTVEEMLVDVWKEVLGRERIGIFDNFFELGGHSLLAVQVVSRVRSLFETEIPLRSIFEAQTIAELAVLVEEALLSEIEEQGEETADLKEAP